MPFFSLLSSFKRTQAKGRGNRRKRFRSRKALFDSLEPRRLLASITWTTGDITDSSDISTNGNLVFAINGSDETGPTTTVNGVNFVKSIRANSASQSQSQSPGIESLSTTLRNDNGGSFTDGGSGGVTGSLIEGGWWGATTGNTANVTLSGLTVGDNYEVQLFASDARGSRDSGYITRLDNGAGGNGVDLQLNNQPTGGRPGDFGIGTFTADSSTQTFNLSGFINGASSEGRIQVNAIQLRRIAPVVLLPGAHPLINEFSASNAGVLDDDNGNSTDWIEIHNAGEDAVNLAGYFLTDDPTNTSKYIFPNTTLAGGQYLVVFAGDDADPTTGSDLYTEFGLSSAGEYVGFYDPAGSIITEFAAGGADYPTQYSDVSYGFVADDTYSVPSYFATPTPGSANINPVDGVIGDLPTVSVDRGFYEQAFSVSVVSQTAGATLVYTTDGTEPSLTNGTQVLPAGASAFAETSISISSTTSLRTVALKTGFFSDGATTHTYVFLDDVIASDLSSSNESNALLRDALLDIPTLSFNYEDVISDSDVPEQLASIEWLAPDGSEGFQVDAGIKGFGGYFTNFAKKNFRVNFRSEYGDSQLEFPLFEGFDNGITATDSFDALDFRSGSHDMSQRGFYMSNRFVDDTLMDAGHVVPHGRFVHIYTNGVYWGQYHMRERWNDDFLAQYYGGDDDDYEAVNGNVNNGQSTPDGWSPGEIYDGDGTAWNTIFSLANDPLPAQYFSRFEALDQVVDMGQYIDYMLLYMAGSSENEYRAGGTSDGSIPYTFTHNDADGWMRGTGNRTDNAGPGNILGSLVTEGDPEFMTLYADRIQNMFGEDGVLSPERSIARLQERLDEIDTSFHAEAARWGYRSHDSWEGAANTAINNMLPDIANKMIANFRGRGIIPSFDAPTYSVNGFDLNGGEVTVGDSLTFIADETIYYTVDGTDPRDVGGGINSSATLYNPGVTTTTVFPFGSESEWKYLDDGSDQGTAWQSTSFNDSGWASGAGELGYGDGDETTVVEDGGDAEGNNKYATTYFRKTFNVPAGSYTSATLKIKRDDGAAVYLDGNQIGRSSNLAADAEFDDYTSGTAETTDTYSISPLLLLEGSHTIAVEIHQASGGSTDISFDAELTLTGQTSTSSQPFTLSETTNVQARTYGGGEWSGVNDATFVIPVSVADVSNLQITEIHYNPTAPSTPAEEAATVGEAEKDKNEKFEFIEIHNPLATLSIDLSGVEFIRTGVGQDGVAFAFGDVSLLPGEYAVIAENTTAFQARYGTGVNLLGQWSGGLGNSGELITLVDSLGAEIASLEYGDSDPWAIAADGNGSSLDLIDPAGTPSNLLDKPYSWRASALVDGTPGSASVLPSGIIISEVLAHTDLPQYDAVELYNPTLSDIDISGWYLSDSGDNRLEYQIPAGTVIAAGGYLTYDETNFNPNPGLPAANDFAFNAAEGDQVFLTEVTPGGSLVIHDSIGFDATFNGFNEGVAVEGVATLGRTPDGLRLVPLANNSLGVINGAFQFDDVIFSEFNYHPLESGAGSITSKELEFLEVTNTGNDSVDLTDWRVRGEVDFDFAFSQSLAWDSSLVIVSFDPTDAVLSAAFRSHYAIGTDVTLVGPFQNDKTLSNSHGLVKLQKPDSPPASDPTFVPHINVDEFVYDDRGKWPSEADGDGPSVHRIGASTLGAFAGSWIAADPTPGSAAAPSVQSIVYNIDGQEASRSEVTSITVTFDADVTSVDESNFELRHVGSDELVTGLNVAVVGNVATLSFTTGDWIVSSNAEGVAATLADGDYELRYKMNGFGGANDNVDTFFRKYGLTSDTGSVGLSDFAAFRSSFGKDYESLNLDNGFRSDLDANRDGTIGLSDFAAFRSAFGN